MPQDEGALDADQRKPDRGHQENRYHGQDLRDQPTLQRIANTVHDDGGAGAMPGGRHEQQAVAIDAWLRGEGKSEKQDNKEVSDRAQTVPINNLKV